MSRIIFDADILKYIPMFESMTGAKVKDCISDRRLLFIVDKGQMGLALGKGGRNLERVEQAFRKSVKVMEFDENISRFVANYLYPLYDIPVSLEGKILKIKGKDSKTKGMLIGRDRENVKKLLSVVKRYFDVEEIAVV